MSRRCHSGKGLGPTLRFRTAIRCNAPGFYNHHRDRFRGSAFANAPRVRVRFDETLHAKFRSPIGIGRAVLGYMGWVARGIQLGTPLRAVLGANRTRAIGYGATSPAT